MGALTRWADRVHRWYEGDAQRPLRGYLVVLGTYGAVGTARAG